MTRLCIIGDSQSGALKLAWDALAPQNPDVSLTFFSAPGADTSKLLPHNGRLEPTTEMLRAQLALTSGGRRHVDPADYDAFLVYGFWLRATGELPDAVSAGFARRVVIERGRTSLMYQHLTNLRGVTDKPLFGAQSPLPSQVGDRSRPALMPHVTEVALIQSEVFDALPATLIVQPEETVIDGRMTRPKLGSPQNSEKIVR